MRSRTEFTNLFWKQQKNKNRKGTVFLGVIETQGGRRFRTPCPKCRAKPSSVQAAAPRCNLISSSPTLLVLRIYCTIVVSCCIPQGKHEGRCPLARACLLRTTVVLRLFLYVHLSGDNSLRRLFFRAGDLFFFVSGMVVFWNLDSFAFRSRVPELVPFSKSRLLC